MSVLKNVSPRATGPKAGPGEGTPPRLRELLYRAFLISVFVLSFLVPVFVAAHFGGVLPFSKSAESGTDQLFPDAVAVSGAEYRIQISSGPDLEPRADTDFLAVSWFKFRKFPARGERMLLLSKSEPGHKLQSGYALALVGDAEGLRPLVFLGDPAGGQWYRFTEVSLVSQQWVMFALTVREGRYLGLHMATVLEPGKSDIRLLGGYDIETLPNLTNQHPVAVAPQGMTRFSGSLGPVGIFQKKALGEELRALLKGLSRTPEDSPELFARKEVSLWWAGGSTDLSQNRHEVNLVVPASRRPGA